MANQMVPGYVKADSTNLPKIDMFMIIEFITSDNRFNAAEVRGAKATLSSRESYGDSAIGYVCLRRENSRCMVRGKMTPEHRVRQKQYSVTLTVHEAEEKIENIECHDCAASTGGCKHAIAFLMWNHRRTETPSPTEVECYWKKSTLSNVGTNKKFITTGELVKSSQSTRESQLPDNSTFLRAVIQKAEEKQLDSQLSRHNFQLYDNKVRHLSIHQLLLKFCDEGGDSADDFIEFAKRQMSGDLCKVAELNTREQSDSPLWFELRYGRVTASKAHEAANCHTPDGSLVKQIIGAAKAINSMEMERGRKLEERVRCEVEKNMGHKIRKSGLLLLPTLPIIGASPDGMTDDFIIEIKCPATEKGFQRFVPNGQVSPKCKAQMNLQMLAAEKTKGLFCVADPNFERNGIISMVWLNYDAQVTCQTVESAVEFWKKNIFPIMVQSIKK